MKRALPVLFSLILATMVFLALPLSASAAPGNEGTQTASDQAANSMLVAGSLSTQDAATPQGEIRLLDEFGAEAWGLNSDPADVTIYNYSETGTAVKTHKGISFDVSSRTITLNNVPGTINAIALHVLNMGDINIKLVGTSKISYIEAENTNLTFIGDGTLFLNSPYTYTDEYGWEYVDEYIFNHAINGLDCKLKISNTVTINIDAVSESMASIILDYNKPTTLDEAFQCAAKPSKELQWNSEALEDGSEHVLTMSKLSFNPVVVPVSQLEIRGIVNKTYTGKKIKQNIIMINGTKALTNGTDYELTYANNVNAGTATVTITGKGLYSGSVTKKFTIAKADNPMKVTSKTKSVSASALKKSNKTVKKAIVVSKNQGELKYTKVAKGSSKKLSVSKNGVIIVAKGKYAKNTTLKINVKVTANGTKNYKKGVKLVVVKVKVTVK